MSDPTLAGRLAHLELPTLVLWGDSDQIVDPGYGRAYAAAIPLARFHLLKDTGGREWQGRQVCSGPVPRAQTSGPDEFCRLYESAECG